MDKGSQHCMGGSDQNYPEEKEMHEGKMSVWGSLQISEKRKDAKDKREKAALSEAALQIAEKRKEAKDKREK